MGLIIIIIIIIIITIIIIIVRWVFKEAWSFLQTLNGALAGMVALCAGCNLYEPWASLIVGGFAGVACIAVNRMMIK